MTTYLLDIGYGVLRHFQQYFSFIGEGDHSILRKPQTCRKSLTNLRLY